MRWWRLNGLPRSSCLLVLLSLAVKSSSEMTARNRMSDIVTDNENIIFKEQDRPSIPSDIVVYEDPFNFEDTPGPPLSPEDFNLAEKINDPDPSTSDEDPILKANLFQGDIRITSNDELFVLSSHSTIGNGVGGNRNAIINKEQKWTSGIIPYEISKVYSSKERASIAKAIAEIHRLTCIKFVPRSYENDYIYMTKGNGCSSAVGKIGGKQTVSLGPGCLMFGIIIHELLHAIGFWHEQSRADRDKYIEIRWDNVVPSMKFNFQKYDWNMIQSLGVTYDETSIMHYGENAFAKNRRLPTIISKRGNKLGQRNKLTKKDLEKIHRLYEDECSPVLTTTKPPRPTKPKPPKPEPTKPKPDPPNPDSCDDTNKYCKDWANLGECEKNPLWMKPNCKKSCKTCQKCTDYNELCHKWSLQGECYKQPDYMKMQCKKSCNHCGVTTNCIDENKYCTEWADSNECDINPKFMKVHCRKSCKTC